VPARDMATPASRSEPDPKGSGTRGRHRLEGVRLERVEHPERKASRNDRDRDGMISPASMTNVPDPHMGSQSGSFR
jgi:hypothetical protein